MNDLYQITVNRETLNDLVSMLSQLHAINTVVGDDGEVSFDIPPNSKTTIKTINIIQDLAHIVVSFEQQQQKMEPTSQEFQELELKKNSILYSMRIVNEIIKI